MDTQQNNASSQPPLNAPASKAFKNTDLYDAITKEDDEIFVATPRKKRSSPFMSMVVFFMKATFYIDSQKRTYESLFHFLGGIWTGFMALIYLGGIVGLVLFFYSRMRIPLYLESFFDNYHLEYDTLKIADYSLSRVEVHGLHDAENKYRIPSLSINSTFADFLRGRIRTITVDDLQLNLTPKTKDEAKTLEQTLKVLGMLTNPTESGLNLIINSISVNKAVLTIENENQRIPISFSITGYYTNRAQVVIPFSINEPFLKMNAKLTIEGEATNRKLKLVINSGTLALKNRAPEDLKGNVVIQASNNKIKQITADIVLNYDASKKTIQTSLTRADNGFNGNLSFVYANTSEGQEDKPLADIAIGFENLNFTNDGHLKTESPLDLKINRFAHKFTLLEGIEGKLSGNLLCSIPNQECTYTLAKETSVRYQKLSTQYKEQKIVIDEPDMFLLAPSTDTLSMKMENSSLQFNLDFKQINLNGYYNVPTNTLALSSNNLQLSGGLSSSLDKSIITINTTEAIYDTPQLKMNNIFLQAQNLLDNTAAVRFSAKEIRTTSPLLIKPISVDMVYLDGKVKSVININDTDVSLIATGSFMPFQKKFVGQFQIPVVHLQDIPFALSELSPIFSKRLNKVSGKFTAAGKLNFSGAANITGPLKIALENVSFYLDETEVNQVNTVIELRSLSPLVSSGNQFISIGKINALIPLTNITGNFKLENQSVRLLDVNTQLGNKTLNLTTALIPYRNPNALLHLKSEHDFKIDSLAPYLNLKGMTVAGGNGILSIPVNVVETGIKIPSVTLKIDNVTLKKVPDQKDVIGLFEKGNNAYMIRNGQLVLDDKQKLNLDLDGWLMPMRVREAFSKEGIPLEAPLFKSGTINPVPTEIKKELDKLMQE